ncbi:unnamed protein product [Darwinula stevensoni]|uniref:Uncharacterized protein n=1 Tax=Darwinula stevensoni TaxID=69355 RepID=A0A7R9A8T3_9CRUS|nr:unnamed protein product [Darwinula stevensoni]CAG0896756.1 unnamed protein product [Darwinula stevensoni]
MRTRSSTQTLVSVFALLLTLELVTGVTYNDCLDAKDVGKMTETKRNQFCRDLPKKPKRMKPVCWGYVPESANIWNGFCLEYKEYFK